MGKGKVSILEPAADAVADIAPIGASNSSKYKTVIAPICASRGQSALFLPLLVLPPPLGASNSAKYKTVVNSIWRK